MSKTKYNINISKQYKYTNMYLNIPNTLKDVHFHIVLMPSNAHVTIRSVETI